MRLQTLKEKFLKRLDLLLHYYAADHLYLTFMLYFCAFNGSALNAKKLHVARVLEEQ